MDTVRDMYRIHSGQRGFSMLEILITLVIMATALLGTAGMQIYAMKVGQGSQYRTQAVFLASDIAERIEANKLGATAGNYVVGLTSVAGTAAVDCATAPCNSAALASWDISRWESEIIALLPNKSPSWSIVQTVTGNPSTYRITINWVDRSMSKTANTATRSESFSYTATRTVRN